METTVIVVAKIVVEIMEMREIGIKTKLETTNSTLTHRTLSLATIYMYSTFSIGCLDYTKY